MKILPKSKLQPAVIGIVICVLLMISRYLGNASASTWLLSLNTVVIIVVLCLSLHLVRRTSELFQKHVWNSVWTLVLLIMPVFNLLVTGVQLIADMPAVLHSPVFNAVLILFSLPVFMCVYFLFLSVNFQDNRTLRILSFILTLSSFVYVIFRLISVIILPTVKASGKTVPEALINLFSHYPEISLLIFLLAIIGFIVSNKEIKQRSNYVDDES